MPDFGSPETKPCGCYCWAVCQHVDGDGNPRKDTSVMDALVHAHVAQARRQGYRNAATRYDPSDA